MKARISEVLVSIQGEGPYVGLPVVFVRFAGCNLRCRYCDTKYAWEGGVEVDIDELAHRVESYNIPNVVYTGGEPLLQSKALENLASALHVKHYNQMIETSASIIPENPEELGRLIRVWILSPKLPMMNPEYRFEVFREFLEEIARCANDVYVKFVLGDAGELELVEKLHRSVIRRHGLYPEKVVLQPLDGGRLSYGELVELVLSKHWGFRVLPQLHKVFGFK